MTANPGFYLTAHESRMGACRVCVPTLGQILRICHYFSGILSVLLIFKFSIFNLSVSSSMTAAPSLHRHGSRYY